MPQELEIDQLERRARSIVESLRGTWRRGKGMCCCPAHDDRTPSLSVTLGRRAILFHCFAGCSTEEVISALRREGFCPREMFDASGASFSPRAVRGDYSPNARRLWQSAQVLAGSPAERYLRKRRLQPGSDQLRFLHQTPLGPRGSVRFLPSMLAAVTNDVGVIALHRTFLDVANDTLACFDRPKRALGSLGCGAVRLAPASSGRLGLAEGIESALSAMQMFGIPCWATLGNERFGLVSIPEGVRELHLFIDHDKGGRVAEERAQTAYRAANRQIVSRVPVTQGFDWNDELKACREWPS